MRRYMCLRGSKGYITGKGKIKTRKLDFEDVCFVKELQHFNLFFVSQICDKKNKVLFTDSECFVLSPEFKLPNENKVLLRIPRQNNMYSFNLENIVPSRVLSCLIAKATIDESNKWHRRLGHVNFKNLNKLVKGNLVRGLPSKIFQNDHTCVACQKGKQHKGSCKAKSVSSIRHSLQLLHMDLCGPTSVRSLNHKTYCLVITDDFSKFKFKKRDFIELYGSKGIKREYSNARTPQQNGVAERKNRTLTTEAEYVAAANYCGQNPVYHSKTKHIAIRHHFIRDAYEKKLIQVLKIHTDDNVADLITKAFDVSSSIHHALTVSPIVSTTFVEQFWMSAKSKIINNVRYITAKVAGKPVSIFEASIRSDLLFDDAAGIDSLPNQAIFDDIQLIGYEGDLTVLIFNKALFSPQLRFLFVKPT
ncbi:putative ribonuclease H-like domain-containing protein [Tanacetum coccineum]